MAFDRNQLPHPEDYYRDCGLRLEGQGKWRKTWCNFCECHTMRVNVKTGAYACTDCGASGGDVLAYHMALTGMEFVEAAKALGAWRSDGNTAPARPTPLSPRAALEVLKFEAMVVAVAGGNVARGVTLSDPDRSRVMQAAGRINHVAGMFA